MAEQLGEKTEKPTPKRLKSARREGRVARSPEISGWLALLTFSVLLPDLGMRAVREISALMTEATDAMSGADPQSSVTLLSKGLTTFLDAAAPVVIMATLVALVSGFGQVGLRFSPGALGFKFHKISPAAGIKRILSPNGAWDLAKMLFRLVLLFAVGYSAYLQLVTRLLDPGTLPLATTMHIAGASLFSILRTIAFAALVVALGDYGFQRRRFNQSMKMTREEVRRELRETDGSPEARKALRRRRRRISRNQILAATSKANVIVVNPTHFSVGLRYDRTVDRAPKVVTKGEDEDALAIRLEARRLGIPIVEEPPVARSLYAACDIGAEVPVELFQTVARLLAFVYRLTPAARTLVDVHHLPA
jgi:flagellar biosynthetic protein FlhB